MVMVVGTQMEMEVPMAMVVVHMEEGREKEMETPQWRETHERKEILREGEEIQMEMGDLVGMETLQIGEEEDLLKGCLLYTSPSPRDATLSRMPSSA